LAAYYLLYFREKRNSERSHRAPRAGAAYQPAAEQLRRELEELTRRRVRLDILQVPGPQEMPGSEEGRLLSR
jgi:hypothetical protein